jgi:hypothetical protein
MTDSGGCDECCGFIESRGEAENIYAFDARLADHTITVNAYLGSHVHPVFRSPYVEASTLPNARKQDEVVHKASQLRSS